VTVDTVRSAHEWTQLLDQPGSTVFHRWDWLTWIASRLGVRFVPLKVLHQGIPVGVAPILVRHRWGIASANIVPFPYLGPVVPAELVAATTREMMRWARRHRVVSMDSCLHPEARVPDGVLCDQGLAEERVDTYLIDLTGRSESELFARLGGDARTAVRRSVKRGVSLRTSTPEDLREVLPAIHLEALGEQAPYAYVLGDALAEGTLPVPARCATALLDGVPVGVSITLGGTDTAVGWLGGVFHAAQASQANAALVWDAIAWAAAEGYATLDMCGAPDPGIAAYKRKFRPRVETHLVGRWQTPGVVALRRLGARHLTLDQPGYSPRIRSS